MRSQAGWRGEFPGDIRVLFHRLRKRGLAAYVVGPAVRDALSSGSMANAQRVDLIVVAPALSEVEKTLDGTATDGFFLSRPERLKRSVSFSIQSEGSGEVLRKVVLTDIPAAAGLEEELAKREVTVNAIALTERGELVDPFRGARDVADALIRPIQAVPAAFAGKPLNLVKVAKHAAYHGYDVAPEVREQAMKFAINVLDVQPERVRPELERLLVNVFPDKGLTFLEETGVLRYILPEVQAMVGFSDTCYLHHKDIWEHTKTVVFRSKPHAAIRWAALLHDIGKVWTRTVDQRGRVHFFRHEEMSAMMFKGIAARFGLEERLAARAQFLVLHHSRINMYTKEWTDSAVRRLIRETGDNLEDLLSLSKADITSRQERRVGELEQLLTELERRIRAIREEDSRAPPLPSGTGDAIMRHFGLQPGPVVGQLRQVLEEAVERGQVERGLPMEKYLEFLQDYVRTHG